MATLIRQKPLYNILPVGQQVIFTVENTNATGQYWNVKYLAEVHIGSSPIDLSTSNQLIGTFKTTPNKAELVCLIFKQY